VMPLGVTVGVRSWISNGKVTGLIPWVSTFSGGFLCHLTFIKMFTNHGI
jgi:hypothetical protein